MQPLTSLAKGQHGTILEIKAAPEERSRLLELGLTPGTTVELVRFAPLGDPVELKVRGSHLSVNRPEADLILVQAAASPATGTAPRP
jgi:Fe2+ transport system protein FeoA